MHIRTIERKILGPREISDHHLIVGLIDLESSNTSFTILAMNERTKESYFLGGASLPTEELVEGGAETK